MQACENWASALLLHLLSDSSASQASSLGQADAEVNNKTAELAQHLLQLQCTPPHDRPALASLLRPAIIASLDELAHIQPAAAHDPIHTAPTKTTVPLMSRETRQGPRDVMSSGAETDSSSDELHSPASMERVNAMADDVAVTHGLRLADSFTVESTYTNKWTNEYFLLNEPSAARAVRFPPMQALVPLQPGSAVVVRVERDVLIYLVV